MTGKPLSHTHHTRHDEAKQSLTDGGMEENRLYILNSTSHLLFPHLPISLSLFSLSPCLLVSLFPCLFTPTFFQHTTAREPSGSSPPGFDMGGAEFAAAFGMVQGESSQAFDVGDDGKEGPNLFGETDC